MRRTVLPALALGLAAATALGTCSATATRPAQDPGEGHDAPGAAPRWPDRARYTLDLAYDRRRFALSGTEQIAFVNVGPSPLQSVWLRAWANAFGGCRAERARVTITSGGTLASRRRQCTALEVRLDRPLAPGAEATVALRIRVTAPPRPDRFGRFRGAAYFGNALPLLAVADRRGWALPPYTFRGESFFSLAAAWDVRLRLPRGTRAATTGRVVRRAAGTLVAAAPAARDFAIVAGPLQATERRAGGVRLRHWRLRESRAGAARCAATRRGSARTAAASSTSSRARARSRAAPASGWSTRSWCSRPRAPR